MATYTGTPQLMRETAQEIRQVPVNLESAYNALQRAIGAYQGENRGATVEAFATVQSEWNTKHGNLSEAGTQAGHALEQIADTIEAGDRAGASQF
ncbi:WXG100 family type VII secretion target [Micromonospora violae]|uniref:WXG100 family type VII secretion target n=1 Tax=Micromonospora violae TaxID=1278207 RepID=UPI0033D14CE3